MGRQDSGVCKRQQREMPKVTYLINIEFNVFHEYLLM